VRPAIPKGVVGIFHLGQLKGTSRFGMIDCSVAALPWRLAKILSFGADGV
jgi:hypothetical protein